MRRMISACIAIMVVCLFPARVSGTPIAESSTRGPADLTGSTSRVVNGIPVTDITEYPFVVDLSAHAVEISSSRFCTGTLIRSNVVLTAAHCVLNDGYSHPVYATVGRIELNDKHMENGRAKTFRTKASIVHPEYQGLGFPKDIAVMLLNESSKAPTVRLSTKSPRENDETWVVGYGVQKLGTLEESGQPVAILSGRLQKTALLIKKKTFCDIPEAHLRTQEGMLCTAGVKEGSSACRGDSGGGLFLHQKMQNEGKQGPSSKETTQVGVVSYGDSKCMSEDSGVFTDVASVKDWADLAVSRLQSAFHTGRIHMDDKTTKLVIHDGLPTSDKLPIVTRPTLNDSKNIEHNSQFYTVQTDFAKNTVITASLCDDTLKSDALLFMASDNESKLVTENPSTGSCATGRLSKLSFTAKQGTYLVGVTYSTTSPLKLSLSSSERTNDAV